MSDDSPRAISSAANKPVHPLYDVDGGRTRRGLAIIVACALFWLAVALLWFHS